MSEPVGRRWQSGVPVGDLLIGELGRWRAPERNALIRSYRNGTELTGGIKDQPDELVVERINDGAVVKVIRCSGHMPAKVDVRLDKAMDRAEESMEL